MVYPPLESLFPHRPPMRLLDSIVGEIDDGLVCKVVVRDDFVFLRDGEAEVVVCVELVAQSVACYAGLRDARRGLPPKNGLLVGCRDARFQGESLRVGDELTVSVKSQWVREPVASFSGRVLRGDELLAEVEVVVISAEGDLAQALGAFHG
jgi:predicted hotdog family 3-hydroxylacyl-ACP dehydratase